MTGRPRKIHPERLREMAAAGMNRKQIAAEMGVSYTAVLQAAVRFGVPFEDGRAERMRVKSREWWADPEYRARQSAMRKAENTDPAAVARKAERVRRWMSDPANNPLAALTPEQRADYDLLRKHGGLKRAEALAALGVEAAR